MNPTLSPLERDDSSMIVTTLNLETMKPEQIDPAAPLFGTGLGLDSIDALELALEISKRYGFQLRSDDEDNRRIFASLANLSARGGGGRAGWRGGRRPAPAPAAARD